MLAYETIPFPFISGHITNLIKSSGIIPVSTNSSLGRGPSLASPKKVTKVCLPDDESIIDESGQGKRKRKAASGWGLEAGPEKMYAGKNYTREITKHKQITSLERN